MAIYWVSEIVAPWTLFYVEAPDTDQARHLVALNCGVSAVDTKLYSCGIESLIAPPDGVIYCSTTGETTKLARR
jgi:hypothetical protein